ncbi:App1 family protein [Zafaria sp. J156]|uniref:App1 family protein n=1 Tax=Zafaria sp. J156 TaxID=3116490 RepID=UPI002E7A57D1|nr:phosphatase domain-containing protein [Zafaria sp. J156]MEE1622287.1 phosphatase domain-containing protein [Zafaria sp. J156]
MAAPNTVKHARHLGVRLEDGWHAFRERGGRSRGLVATVLPFRGYGVSGADGWVRVFARIVLARPGAFTNGLPKSKVVSDGVRGWRNFISPPIPHAEVVAEIGGRTFRVDADRGGVLDVKITVDLAPGWHAVTLRSESSEPADVSVFVVDRSIDFGVVSDIDDTVVVTALPRPLLAAWNSFVLSEHARVATPGMAVMMERLMRTRPGSPVLYLSTGAWNVAPTLTRFLSRNLYPAGALLLTDWGPTEGRWFRSGQQHKVDQLRRLAAQFPHISWLLVGDDGQHDPEIYAEFARRHPGQVRAIAIRQLTPSEAVLAGGRSMGTMDSTPGTPWVYAPDGAGICEGLERLGLLEPERVAGPPTSAMPVLPRKTQ